MESSDRQLLEPMPLLDTMPPTAEIKNWLLGKRPAFCHTDDILHSSVVHPQVQRLLNFEHRMRAACVSPDLRDQLHVVHGTDTSASFPHHGPNNVRPVPLAFNLLKRTSFEETGQFTCVAPFEMNQEDFRRGWDRRVGVDEPARPLDIASSQPKYLTLARKTEVMAAAQTRKD